MRINGAWVGWGLGDNSQSDPLVRNFKAFARRMYRSYMGHLADTNAFDQQLYDALVIMQDKLVAGGKLVPGKFIRGVLDLPTQEASGFRRPAPPNRPIIFTVEGHMSNPWVGPCAWIASTLEAQGVCWWQPVGYDTVKLPFNNKSGRDELVRLLNNHRTEAGHPFPPGTPWGLMGFSQGAIITNQVYLDYIRSGSLNWRERDLTRAIAFGDPYREKDVDSGWWPDPPKKGTQGISDRRMTNTPYWWKSANRTGDLYTENPDNEVGLYRTSIYKIAAENSWSGGPAGMLRRLMDLLTPTDDIIPIFKAITGGVLFLGNMAPHGGYDLGAPLEYMRGVARRP